MPEGVSTGEELAIPASGAPRRRASPCSPAASTPSSTPSSSPSPAALVHTASGGGGGRLSQEPDPRKAVSGRQAAADIAPDFAEETGRLDQPNVG